MKSTLIWFLILCSQALSQNAGTFIYVSDYSILYRGYNNHVEFGVTDGSKYRIALEGVELKTDTSFYSNQLRCSCTAAFTSYSTSLGFEKYEKTAKIIISFSIRLKCTQ